MRRNKLWKNLTVLLIVLLGVLLALPSFFPVDPALQIGNEDGSSPSPAAIQEVRAVLQEAGVAPSTLETGDVGTWLLFDDLEDQRLAADAIAAALPGAVVAFALEPRLPRWLEALGLEPVSLGLDLRGGVHFRFDVDLDAVTRQLLETQLTDLGAALRSAGVRAASETRGEVIAVTLERGADPVAARAAIRSVDAPPGARHGNEVRESESAGRRVFEILIPPDVIAARQDLAMEQNLTTLRNRVDELGVSEPVVQRQGRDGIIVQVPGVQDPAQLDRILGSTATLEWRLVDTARDPFEAARNGRTPQGSILRFDREGTPVLLQRRVIASGEQLTDATFGYSEGRPAVFIRLDGQGAGRMLDATIGNVGKPLAVLMIEETNLADGELGEEIRTRRTEKVIFVGRIDGVFSSDFRLAGGFTPTEAQDLALVLRSGALAAPMQKGKGGMIGPTLGQENVRRGQLALIVGFLAIAAFMTLYYGRHGMIAILALLANLFIMVGALAFLGASLTLPGMAGIVLTLGMAVDANVLIIERIREELARGRPRRSAISSGYEKAWSSILDANVTTLVAGVVLLSFGTGPIKGFAVTLTLGIATSMFTAVAGTRAVFDLLEALRGPRLTNGCG